MGQILHFSATTTEGGRRAIQHSQESLGALSKCYGISQKTVAKWKARTSVSERSIGPSDPANAVAYPHHLINVGGTEAERQFDTKGDRKPLFLVPNRDELPDQRLTRCDERTYGMRKTAAPFAD